MSHLSKQHNVGFTLIETLVAVTILMIAAIAPMALIQDSLQASEQAKQRITTYFLAQDAMEYVKHVRNVNLEQGNNWLNGLGECISNSCTIDTTMDSSNVSAVVGACGSACPPLRFSESQNRYGYNSGWDTSRYTRSVEIERLQGDSEARISVTVQWDGTGGGDTFTATENIYRYQ